MGHFPLFESVLISIGCLTTKNICSHSKKFRKFRKRKGEKENPTTENIWVYMFLHVYVHTI